MAAPRKVSPITDSDRETRYGVLGLGVFFAALLGLILIQVAIDPRTLRDGFALTAIGGFSVLVAFIFWVTTRGWFGPGPTDIAIDPEAVRFTYAKGPPMIKRWDAPTFAIGLFDVYAEWDPKSPGVFSQRYWFKPPRGRPFPTEEPVYRAAVRKAEELRLSVKRSRKRIAHGVWKTKIEIRARAAR